MSSTSILETWFIERPEAEVWCRYAGPFDTYARAELYFKRLCPPHYRITKYEPVGKP